MAYGQTGSGKTYTIQVLLKNFVAQFESVLIEISAVEVYNNDLYDLLKRRQKLRMPSQGRKVQCRGLQAFEQVYTMLTNERTTKRTDNNSTSSRSHMVLSLLISGQLYHFVDLAGFEEHTNAESHHINMSLYFLRDCVLKMRRKQPVAIRQSKLTWCLFETLVENIICVCTILPKNQKQTQHTLDYGVSFKGVKPTRVPSAARLNVKKYGEHTHRLSTLEANLMNDYIQKPSAELKRIIRQTLLHRKEMIDHMLKNIFGS